MLKNNDPIDLHQDMEQQIANVLPFGAFWINEQKAADIIMLAEPLFANRYLSLQNVD